MRDEWTTSELIRSSPGLARGSTYGSSKRTSSSAVSSSAFLASKAMRLKLSGKLEVSERRQVGDAEEMFSEKGASAPWWRNVGMEEGM